MQLFRDVIDECAFLDLGFIGNGFMDLDECGFID